MICLKTSLQGGLLQIEDQNIINFKVQDTSRDGQESAIMTTVAPAYFTHFYTFSERGTNEVYNRMIRRNFPKGESLDAISSADVAKIAKQAKQHTPSVWLSNAVRALRYCLRLSFEPYTPTLSSLQTTYNSIRKINDVLYTSSYTCHTYYSGAKGLQC